MKPFVVVAIISLIIGTFQNDLFHTPKGWPAPVYDFKKNPLKEEIIYLGRALFYDPMLSKDGTISCASCHSPFSAFTHVDHALSHGIHDSIGRRNSPALMNLAWHKQFMWDGAIHHLDVQALAPISHPAEMGSSISEVVTTLQKTEKYRTQFKKAFGSEEITGEKTLKAISQFLLTLVSCDSKYDRWKKGEVEFSTQEQKGYALYQSYCSSCHREPLFSNYEFKNNGLQPDPSLNDAGRAEITHNPADSFQFKVPTLRNIEYTYPYMHDGRFEKLSEVMNHYGNLNQNHSFLSPELQKLIQLSPNEKIDLIAFLLTLSDKNFVFNKNFQYPHDFFNTK